MVDAQIEASKLKVSLLPQITQAEEFTQDKRYHRRYPTIALQPNGNLLLSFLGLISDNDSTMKAFHYPTTELSKKPSPSQSKTLQSPWWSNPSIAVDDSGNYAILWVGQQGWMAAWDVFVQRYDIEDNPIGDPIPVLQGEISETIFADPSICYGNGQ